MTPSEIIVELGDTRVVAGELSTSLAAVSNWKARGIPRSRWLDVAEMAARKGKTGITPDIIRGSGVDSTNVEPSREAAA